MLNDIIFRMEGVYLYGEKSLVDDIVNMMVKCINLILCLNVVGLKFSVYI